MEKIIPILIMTVRAERLNTAPILIAVGIYWAFWATWRLIRALVWVNWFNGFGGTSMLWYIHTTVLVLFLQFI